MDEEHSNTTEIRLDVGNLAAFDERTNIAKKTDEAVAHEAVDTLLRALLALPTNDEPDGRYVTLPKGNFKLPREKPIPKERAPTKWEKYALEKGIQKKKKRDRLVLDETTGEYVPRFGRGSKNSAERDIVLPHKEGMGDDYDPFSEKRQEKKKRIKANKKQYRQNLGRAAKASRQQVQPMQALNVAKKGPSGKKYLPKDALRQSLSVVQRSTASAGQFDKAVPNEPKKKTAGRKKKYESFGGKQGTRQEKQRLSQLADRVLKI